MITHPVLHALAGHGVRLGLDRIEAFLQSIGSPHRAYPVVHIAGTNGKGSTSAMVEAALRSSGLLVGVNGSPHLEHVNERVRIDGAVVSDAALDRSVRILDAQRRSWGQSQGLSEPLTYFEFSTALAMAMFAERQVDVGVFEVGLGGRLDATNVVSPAVCAITSIGLDHTDKLGDTHAKIAVEKAGIFKDGVPAVVGEVVPSAAEAIAGVARDRDVDVWWVGRDVRWQDGPDGWRAQTPVGQVGPVSLGLQGAHQAANAAVALGVLHRLQAMGWDLSNEAISEGLRTAFLPGRLEWLRDDLLVDGAHNLEGARALAAYLMSRPKPRRRTLLFGMGAERDPRGILEVLLPHVEEVVLTKCAHPKAATMDALTASLAGLSHDLRVGGDIEDCLWDTLDDADEVVVTGSLYLVGAVRSLWAQGR